METETPEGSSRQIWAVHDGNIGNARQARALAEAVAARWHGEVVDIPVKLRPALALLPAWGWALGGAHERGWPFTGLAGPNALRPPWPALVIGAGRRVAPLVAAIRQLSGNRAVQILRPGMRHKAFDIIVTPRHDAISGENTMATQGALHDLTPARITEEAARWRMRLSHVPSPRVAVLVGGPSRSADFGAHTLERLSDALVRLAIDGAGLMVTPSRRTPRAVVDRLADTIGGVGGWMWSGIGDNPYPAILGLADAILVTADSVNLASEAASTGKPVMVMPVDRLAAKLSRFHDSLAAHGATRPFAGTLEQWHYAPLDETGRVAERVATLLNPSGAATAAP